MSNTSPPSAPIPANEFTHLDEKGKVKMVDVSHKSNTKRRAVASAQVKSSLLLAGL